LFACVAPALALSRKEKHHGEGVRPVMHHHHRTAALSKSHLPKSHLVHRALEGATPCDVKPLLDLMDSWVWTSAGDGEAMLRLIADCDNKRGKDEVAEMIKKVFDNNDKPRELGYNKGYNYWVGALKSLKNKPSSPWNFFDHFNKRAWCFWLRGVRGADQFKYILSALELSTEKLNLIDVMGPETFQAKLVIEKISSMIDNDQSWAKTLSTVLKWSEKIPKFKEAFPPARMFGIYGDAIKVAANFSKNLAMGGLYGRQDNFFKAAELLATAKLCDPENYPDGRDQFDECTMMVASVSEAIDCR